MAKRPLRSLVFHIPCFGRVSDPTGADKHGNSFAPASRFQNPSHKHDAMPLRHHHPHLMARYLHRIP